MSYAELLGDRIHETLADGNDALASVFRAGEREYGTYGATFRASIFRHETPAGWLGEYGDAYDRTKEVAGTDGERKVLRAAVTDWEYTGPQNREWTAWNAAHAANRVLQRQKTYKTTVTKVAARCLDMVGATAAEVWTALEDSPEVWSDVRDTFDGAGNMDKALKWAQHGGDPADPDTPDAAPRSPSGGDEETADVDATDADILDAVEAAYDATAREAVAKILISARERIARTK